MERRAIILRTISENDVEALILLRVGS